MSSVCKSANVVHKVITFIQFYCIYIIITFNCYNIIIIITTTTSNNPLSLLLGCHNALIELDN